MVQFTITLLIAAKCTICDLVKQSEGKIGKLRVEEVEQMVCIHCIKQQEIVNSAHPHL